jgi:hypothetical protein
MFSSDGYTGTGVMGPAFDPGSVPIAPLARVTPQGLRRAAQFARDGFLHVPTHWPHAARRAFYTARARWQGLAGHQNRHNRARLLTPR